MQGYAARELACLPSPSAAPARRADSQLAFEPPFEQPLRAGDIGFLSLRRLRDQQEQEAAEQADTEDEPESEAPQAKPASDDVFRPLSAEKSATPSRDLEMIMDIPVKLTVELGRTKLTIKQLLELAQGSVIELEGLAGEPMDILINGYLIAQGEVVVIEDKYGIRITEIITPSERIHKLNR